MPKKVSDFEKVIKKSSISEGVDLVRNFIINGYSDELNLDSSRSFPSSLLMISLKNCQDKTLKQKFNKILLKLSTQKIEIDNPIYIREIMTLLIAFRNEGSIDYIHNFLMDENVQNMEEYNELESRAFRGLISIKNSYDSPKIKNIIKNKFENDLDPYLVPQIMLLSKEWDEMIEKNIGKIANIINITKEDKRWAQLMAKSLDKLYECTFSDMAYAKIMQSLQSYLKQDFIYLGYIIDNSKYNYYPMGNKKGDGLRGMFIYKEGYLLIRFKEDWIPPKGVELPGFYRNTSTATQYNELYESISSMRIRKN